VNNNNNDNNEISLKLDVVFKQFFTKKGNEELLEDFLSSILSRKVKCKSIIKEARIGQKRPDEKYGSLDIRAILDDEVEVDVEMQVTDNKDTINRAIYYMSTLTTEGLKPTEQYDMMKQKIVIFLMDYELFNLNETVVSSYICLNEDKEYELSTLQKYYFIDLTKVQFLDDKNKRRLKLWLAFLNRDKEMLKMVKTDKILNKAEEEYEYLSGDEEIKRLTELRNRAIRELKGSYSAGLKEGTEIGIQKGIEKGIKEGIQKGKTELVKNMLLDNVSTEKIIKYTNLTKEQILNLKKEI